jgi:tRNA G10  N-methylase Trm11
LTIKHLAYRLAHEYPGGATRLADEMGKSTQVLINKLNPNSETHHLTIAELETLADFTNRNIDVAEYFAQKAGAVVVPMPEIEQGDLGLLESYMLADEERGELSKKFRKAFEDGRIDAREFAEIKTQIYAVIAKQLAWLSEIERVVR